MAGAAPNRRIPQLSDSPARPPGTSGTALSGGAVPPSVAQSRTCATLCALTYAASASRSAGARTLRCCGIATGAVTSAPR